jgi:hypothetical protein
MFEPSKIGKAAGRNLRARCAYLIVIDHFPDTVAKALHSAA